uniref:Uncharacterized protein n=1 Tax=Bursaphelenchus xylophilus TaxID=6326 RepID=A0A1I7SK75_BURXY
MGFTPILPVLSEYWNPVNVSYGSLDPFPLRSLRPEVPFEDYYTKSEIKTEKASRLINKKESSGLLYLTELFSKLGEAMFSAYLKKSLKKTTKRGRKSKSNELTEE